MIFKLIENVQADNNSIILYRTGKLDSTRGIWMTTSESYAKTYSRGTFNTYRVELGKVIEVEGYPTTCPFLMYKKLFGKPLKGNNYFNEEGIAENVDDLAQSEINRLVKTYLKVYPDSGEYIHKHGNNYDCSSIVLQYAIDYLNADKARKLGYDTIIYRMKAHAEDEYCVLNKNNITAL
jgi:hypothetical protein